MEFSASQIADLLGGEIEGNKEVTVNTLSKIEEGVPGSLTFLANPKYEQYIYNTGASIAIVNKDFTAETALPGTLTLIKVENAYACFAKLLEFYDSRKHSKTGIDKSAVVEEGAQVGEDVYLGANVVISSGAKIGNGARIYANSFIGENASIGDNSILYAGTTVYNECIIGKDCILHSGVIIGGDGFGFSPKNAESYQKVPQIGNVVLSDGVEIGANTTIDRATIGSTRIGTGVKLDNLIQVAHNVEIGDHTVIAAQTGIAGSTKIGKNCMIGGQVGIVGHIEIADEVKIAAQSGIGSSIKTKGAIVQGSPAFDIGDYKRSYVGFRRLPQILERIDKLEAQLKELNQRPKE